MAEPARPSSPYYPPVSTAAFRTFRLTTDLLQLPWISSDDQSFPKRAARRKRKIARSLLATEPIVFPREQPADVPTAPDEHPHTMQEAMSITQDDLPQDSISTPTQSATPLASEAPSDAPSDAGSTQPTTPSSAVASFDEKTQRTPTQPKAHRATKSVVPAVPILPQNSNAAKRPHRDSLVSTTSKTSGLSVAVAEHRDSATPASPMAEVAASDLTSAPEAPVVSAAAPPKSWADLVRTKAAASAQNQATVQLPNGAGSGKTETLSDVLNDMSITEHEPVAKITFLEPRGLVNTGNMCYMNSVRLTDSHQ